jgi:recombinational DNA repair ATPase RecF
MATRIIETGKFKGHQISECDTKYLKWLTSHERVLAERNRWLSRDARYELQRRAQAAAEAAMAVKVAEAIIAEAMKEKTMTNEEKIAEYNWAAKLGLQVRQDARVFERKRNLTDQEVLDRIKDPADKERFIRGKSYQPLMY